MQQLKQKQGRIELIESVPNGCAQKRRMHIAWYIRLHTVCIRRLLCAYAAFVFSMYAGTAPPRSGPARPHLAIY